MELCTGSRHLEDISLIQPPPLLLRQKTGSPQADAPESASKAGRGRSPSRSWAHAYEHCPCRGHTKGQALENLCKQR